MRRTTGGGRALALALGLVTAGAGESRGLQTQALIPAPVSVEYPSGGPFVLSGSTPIIAESDDPAVARIASFLDELIGPRTRLLLRMPDEISRLLGEPVETGPPVRLRLADRRDLGPEGYELTVQASEIVIEAETSAGLFYGAQTLRQMMPSVVEYEAALIPPMRIPPARVVDRPRYGWRGAMLDVARHFFEVRDVERLLDLMAMYKLNILHLHLTDDQGWRIEIPGRSALTEVGGLTQVGGGPGGYYTVEDYERIVAYAAERFITVVPEIDLPGHSNAALASIPAINCDGRVRPPYVGIRVGFSTVCVEREETYAFVEDVIREIAARTPGSFFHVGGDEVRELEPAEYAAFMARTGAIVAYQGKIMVGWDEIAEADLPLRPGTFVQVWRPGSEQRLPHLLGAVEAGARLVLSPADRIYLDLKYDEGTPIGLDWAGLNDTRDAYDWDPETYLEGVPAEAIEGVEATLWSETIATIGDIEFLAFPRLAGVAEIGWSPRERRTWDDYRIRLGAHGPRWIALGLNFHRSPLVPWQGRRR
ncbi:MAG TPA: beta-N-acetylhexosaminidase [Longimicrobiales bacterium]|nr:beta-N-acetylhexosaminidase [Longimicrobiales bacterium]